MDLVEEICVTGYGAISPLGATADAIIPGLQNPVSPSRPLKDSAWEKFVQPQAASISWEVSQPHFYDRSVQWALEAVQEALNRAQLSAPYSNLRIGITFSSSKGGLQSLLKAHESMLYQKPYENSFLDFFNPGFISTAIQSHFQLSGPALSVALACSTGAGSIGLGADWLLNDVCDLVIAGSTEASILPLIYAAFKKMNLLTKHPQGCKPFDQERDGFLMGEGCGVLLLEKSTSVYRRHGPIFAKLSAWTLQTDGTNFLEVESNGASIRRLIEKTMGQCHNPTVDYIHAHGTGTHANDQVEAQALETCFGSEVPVSSTKGATGHLLGAAASLAAVICLESLRHDWIPDTFNLNHPDPACPILHVPRYGQKKKLNQILMLSYGIGGQLAALVFSKPTAPR